MKKIALITGGSRGIGAAIALGLVQDGFDIWLNYKQNHEAGQKIQAEIQALQTGTNATTCTLVPFDVCQPQQVSAALEPLLTQHTPTILINNAGYTKDMIFGLMENTHWHEVLDVHLTGFFNVTRKVSPHMQRARCGRIINIVSTSGQTGVAGQVNYCAAKAGLIGATKALARELASRNVLVNAVAPGFITTDLTQDLNLNKHLALIPQGRPGTPEEVAACVRFLCSEGASYITGQVLAVNGGLYM